MLKIHKELIVSEDVVWGFGTVSQLRDQSLNTPTDYNKINAATIPAEDKDKNQTSTIQAELDKRLGIAEANLNFAKIAGSATQTFMAAPATKDSEVPNKKQVTDQIDAAVSQIQNNYAKRSNVLGLDQTASFVPTKDYHPATKLYVDNKVVQIGAGDMAKGTYDKTDSGIVDNAEAIGGVKADDVFVYRGTGTSLDANNFNKMGNWIGQTIANAPDTSTNMIANFHSTTTGIAIQMAFSQGTKRSYQRDFDGSNWTPWETGLASSDIVKDFSGSAGNAFAVAGADTVKQLHADIAGISGVPIGTITMFGGNVSNIPSDWHICDGKAGTPNLSGKFIKGTTDPTKIGGVGGTSHATMPPHTHTANHTHTASSNTTGSHYHAVHHTHSASFHGRELPKHTHSEHVNTVRYVGTGGNISFIFGDKGTSNKNGITIGSASAGTPSGSVTVNNWNGNSSSAGNHKHTITINTATVTTGSASVSGDNEPPFHVLIYIMKVS